MTAWFRWERDFARRWTPVVIYGDKPRIGTRDGDRFTPAVEVPSDCLSADGSPLFGQLQEKFPAPREE